MKFSPAFFKRRCRPPTAVVALRRARNLYFGVFFLKAFSFAPASSKEKANGASDFLFLLLMRFGFWIVGETIGLPLKKHNITFPLSYFCVTKSTKSQQGGLTPSSFRTTGGVHELVARALRGKCVRQQSKAKISSFATPRNLTHTTRANISHEIAEQIRARIVRTPAESVWRGLTHMRSMCVGVAETGHRGSVLCADGMKAYFLFCILLTDISQKKNRLIKDWHDLCIRP